MRKLTFLFIFLILIQAALALDIEDPGVISEARLRIIETGNVSFSGGSATKLELNISIPIEDKYQNIERIDVDYPYKIIEDEFGNKYVNMVINNPSSEISYKIEMIVNTKRRMSGQLKRLPKFKSSGLIINSDNYKIAGLAKNLTSGYSSSFDKVGAITKFVNEEMKYDIKYSNEDQWNSVIILNNKVGVCHHYAVLEAALLRALDFYTSYSSGYVYSNNSFGPHAWVEACDLHDCWSIDPTFGYSPVDALHIKYKNDPNLISLKDFSVEFTGSEALKTESSTETKIEILEYKEDSLIKSIDLKASNETISEGDIDLISEIKFDGCVISKLYTSVCSDIFTNVSEKIFFGCNNATAKATTTSIPKNDTYIYMCRIMQETDFGGEGAVNVTLEPKLSKKSFWELILEFFKSLFGG